LTGRTQALVRFLASESVGGVVLIACAVVSISIANSAAGESWSALWQWQLGSLTFEHWVNDGLMALFFLLVGLELEREIYDGELSELRSAVFPIAAAVGGALVPAAIHFALNGNTPSQPGAGIPIATDIAFALAALSLLGRGVPLSLKVFLTAFAIMDDLIAVTVIGLAYSSDLSPVFMAAAAAVLGLLILASRMGIMALTPYVVGGLLLWLFTLKSGIHATVSGVMLAFAMPYSDRGRGVESPSRKMERLLHAPVGLLVLPVFALANTAIVANGAVAHLVSANSIGIAAGLIVGKPVGIMLGCLIATRLGSRKPATLSWAHVFGVGLLGGIGFTMSIFIANLAFPAAPEAINAAKLAIVVGSVVSAAAGLAWLSIVAEAGRRPPRRS